MYFGLVLHLDVLERLDEFFENVDQTLSLILIGNTRFLLGLIAIDLILKLLPEAVVLIDEHFESTLDILILIEVVAIVVQLLDGFGQLRVDFDELFQALLQQVVLVLELLVAFFQLLEFALPSEVVLETFGHTRLQLFRR